MKKILDACCGSRMFWFNKNHPDAVYMDNRSEEHILCDGRRLTINPDIEMDFRNMEFSDNTFHLVIFDPPHLIKLGKNSWMAKKYGVLSETWQEDIKKGFDECWRVLKENGTLIFKWNERDVKINEIINLIGKAPLFGHTTKSGGYTIWMCFMKVGGGESL